MKQALFAILLILSAALPSTAQNGSMKTLRRQQQTTQKEIRETSKKIKSNTAKTQTSLNQLYHIEAEITEQQKTISELRGQLNGINAQMRHIGDSIAVTQQRLQSLRTSYAKAMRSMHAHSSSFDRLLFLFSSSSFHQAFRRFRYLQQFSRWRARQTQQIAAVQRKLITQHNLVRSYYSLKNKNLVSQNMAQLTLVQKRQEQSQTIATLKQEGSQLQSILAEKKRKAQALDAQLDRLIAEQERKAAERARIAEQRRQEQARQAEAQRQRQEEAARAREEQQRQLAEAKAAEPTSKQQAKTEKPKKQRTKPSSRPPVATEQPAIASANIAKPIIPPSAEDRLSGSFESNKGRLPFPVTGSCRIVKPFGRQRHPELRYVETDNGGIDIETSPGAVARAVFTGTVSAVFRQDGFNTVVMVRHGSYLTIYVNLSDIYVNSGEQVKPNQAIGKVFSDPEDGNRTILHFEVRHERQKLNPQEWLR